MKKRKRILTWVVVCAVLLAMAAVIAVLAHLNAPKDVDGERLALVQGENTLASWTIAELQEMPAVEAYKEISSSNHANDAGLFRGVALYTLLQSAGGEALQNASKVYVYAKDGYMTSYKMSEISNNDGFLLAYSKDGQSLGSMGDDNGSGPLRLVVVSDEFGTRSCKYVYKIEIK